MELTKGKVYLIKLTSGSWTEAEFVYTKERQSYHGRHQEGRTLRHFMFLNKRTGRAIEIKSKQKIQEVANA